MMLKEERQQSILNLLYENGKVNVDELAERFRSSKDTIRRDLTVLEEEGILKRVYGGAVPVKAPALTIDERKNIEKREKYLVARKALRLLRPHSLIAVDGGTTNLLFASLLPFSAQIRVVTNSFLVAQELRKRPEITVIFLGGVYNKQSQTTVGSIAVEQMQKFHFDQCFLGAYAVDAENGISVPYPYEDEAAVKRCMVEHSDEVLVMGAVSKLDKRSNYVVCKLDEVDWILCEHPVTQTVQNHYHNKICW